ncbi:MAG: cytochrome ubiquinol oxidase subunit I, partial [Porphyrobacter sp.]|nr:cytochrome ubiquinol oxidase subunit I [Porphyrobacter sp.]
LMAYEVLTAFFLEAGFLGVMLFGMEKVGRGLHFAATVCVALGTLLSSFWILAANSWMQTPQGFEMGANGQFLPGPSWWAIIFNPSFPYRLAHTVTAAFLATALVVGGVGGWHLLRGHATPQVKKMFSMAMWMAALVAPIQVLIGDQHGLNTWKHQPAKIMAIEGHYESHPDGAPFYLFGLPNDRTQHLDYAVGIPKVGSLLLEHRPDAPVAGLDTIPDDRQPPAAIVFWSFRLMVGLGLLMFALGLLSLWARWRGSLYRWRLLHGFALAMSPMGLVAIIAGWVTTEVGRQPYLVYGLLRTSQSMSPLGAPAVATSLLAFVVIYFAVFGVGIWYILRLMHMPPHPHEEAPAEVIEAPLRTAGITPGPAQLTGEDEA